MLQHTEALRCSAIKEPPDDSRPWRAHVQRDGSPGIPVEWMDLRQVTQYAKVSNRTLRGWIHAPIDPLPTVKIARKHLVRRSELDRWLEKRRVRPVRRIELDTIVRDVIRAASHGR